MNPTAQKEAPACEAGESANNKGNPMIVSERLPCAGIVPRDFDRHLAALAKQQAGVDAGHVENVREHEVVERAVRSVLAMGEVQL